MNPKKAYRGIPPVGESAEDIRKKHRFESKEKTDSNRMIFFIIAVLLVFIIVGVGILLVLFMGKVEPPTPPAPPNITNVTNVTNITPSDCDDNCLLDSAISLNLLNICDNINDSSISQKCYLNFADTYLTACLEIEDKSTFNSCVKLHAVEKNDISICSNLDEANIQSCKTLIDPCFGKTGSEQNLCFALSKKDYSLCKGEEECIFNYSKTTKTTQACSVFPDDVNEQACKSIVLNTDKCFELPLYSQKDLCYQIYAMKSDDNVICTAISPDSLYALECFSYFSVEKGDQSLCDMLSLDNKWACYTNYSLNSGDLSGCDSIHKLATTARFNCFFKYAKSRGDPSACDLISNLGQAGTCYVGSIMNNTLLDLETCKDVQVVDWKNKCFMQSAKLQNDTSICNFIETENERKSCELNVKVK
jgi:hypothetical protein